MNKITNRAVANAAKWSLITEIIARLIAPITNMILARLLTPGAFGAVATITMIISFAEVFTDAGFQKYIIQHDFTDENDFNESVNVAFWSNFCVSSLAVAIIWVFRDGIAKLVGATDLSLGIAVASFSIVLVAFSSIQIAIYRRNLNFKTLFSIRIMVSLVPLFVTIPLALLFRNYWALVIGTLVMNLIQAIALTVKSDFKFRIFYSFSKLKNMFSFASWTLLESISIWLTTYIDTFIVGVFLTDYYLGLYKTSMSTISSYMNIITAAVTPVLFATLSRYQNDDELFKRTFLKFQRLLSLLIIPMGIGIYIYRDFVTRIILGAQWLEASNFIGVWGLMNSFTIVICYLSSEVYRSKGKPKYSLLYQIIHICFLIPAIIISVKYEFEVLATVRALLSIQFIITALIFLQFIFKIKCTEIIKNIFPSIISSIIMGIAGFYLSTLSNNFLWQFISVLICIILYFTILLLLFPKIRKEISSMDIIQSFLNKLKKQ